MKPTLPLMLLTAVFTACASMSPDDPKLQTLGTVNDEPITVTELREQFVKRHGGHTKFLGGEVELRKFLDIVIDQRLLVQEAYNLGLQDDKQVKEATDAYREDKSVAYLIKSEIEDKSNPTKDEIREAWEKNTSMVYQVRQIAVDTKQEAEEVRAALLYGADFDQLARQCSFAQSRVYGGQLVPLGWGTMDPEWEENVFKLEPGEVSPVFETADGWQVVQLQDKQQVTRPDFAKARSRIEGILKKRKLDERRKQFSDELWARYRVELKLADRTPRSLMDLKKRAPDTVVATWDGGSMPVKDVLSPEELHMLSMYPPERGTDEIDKRLRQTINDPLVNLEVKARKTAEAPEVAEEVRMFQEDRMESLLYDQHILKEVKVTDDDIKAYYDEHKAQLVAPEKRKISHIVVQSEEAAKELRNQLVNGEDFVALVKSKSSDVESARSGGDLGWITAKQVPAEFAAVLKLQEGDVSEPIQSKFGWHLIKVTKIEPERPLTFEESKDDIRKVVLQNKQKEARAYWVKKLRDAAKIDINKRAIRAYVKTNEFVPKDAPPQHGAK